MSSFTSSPQRSKSTSAEHSVEVHGSDAASRVLDGAGAVNPGSNTNTTVTSSNAAPSVRKKRTMTTSRRKQEEQKLKAQELAEEPPDDYTRTTVEKMRSLMQATQPKLPITKVIELVGIPTNKFYELRKRYLPGVYRTASSKKHRMNSEEEQVAVKKIRAFIQESPHATMQEIIKRVGLPTTKFYDLRRRFLSHMFDGSSSKRKTPNSASTTAANSKKAEQKNKPAIHQQSSANHQQTDDDDDQQDQDDEDGGESSESSSQHSDDANDANHHASAAAAALLSSSNHLISTTGNNNFNYTTNNAAAEIAAAGLIMSHFQQQQQQQQQPTSSSSTSFISCLQPAHTAAAAVSDANAVNANFVSSFTAGDFLPGGGGGGGGKTIKLEPFVGALAFSAPHTTMQMMPTSSSMMNTATLPFINADQFGNLTAMHGSMPTSMIDFSQHQQQQAQLQQQQQQLQQQLQQQQQQVVQNMHPYWAYTTSTTMLPDK